MQLVRSAPKSVLIIDGGQKFCLTVERAFRQVGAAVFTFSDGQRAIEHLALCGARYPAPDLVLLDRLLPGGPDGHSVLRAARALDRLRGVSILMIGSSSEPEHAARALADGADGYLVKPPEESDYPQLVRSVLDWHHEKSWSEVGPKLAGNALAHGGAGVGSPPMMALETDVTSLLHPAATEQPLLERVVNFLSWCQEKAEASLDPFQQALNRACRRHKLTPVQAQKGGGSQPLREARRLVVADLHLEGWPDETLLTALPINRTELKRIKRSARAKVGPKLDGVRN